MTVVGGWSRPAATAEGQKQADGAGHRTLRNRVDANARWSRWRRNHDGIPAAAAAPPPSWLLLCSAPLPRAGRPCLAATSAGGGREGGAVLRAARRPRPWIRPPRAEPRPRSRIHPRGLPPGAGPLLRARPVMGALPASAPTAVATRGGFTAGQPSAAVERRTRSASARAAGEAGAGMAGERGAERWERESATAVIRNLLAAEIRERQDEWMILRRVCNCSSGRVIGRSISSLG